jgi:DNA-binding transcriptional regulator YiaG
LLKISETPVQNWEQNRSGPVIPRNSEVIKFLGYDLYTTKETFGGKIIRARKSLGITQKELAGKLGVGSGYSGEMGEGRVEAMEGSGRKDKLFS